jgi:DNA-binding CsgD family transcriptional regulator
VTVDVPTRTPWLKPELLSNIHELWDGLADFPAGKTDEALQFLLAGLCDLFDASCACWTGATREAEADDADALRGWRTHGLVRVSADAGYALDPVKERRNESVRDLSLVRYLAHAGQRFRAQRWSELVEADWFESDYFRANYDRRVRDAVYVGFPLSSSAESMFTVQRAAADPAFSEQERDGIGYALRGIKRFHRHLMLSFGLIGANAKLTNTERKVLQQLLTGRTEKEVAAELALSYHTTHAHVASILKKFGASNRPSLMALWLSPSG